jgi:hypothetical protein
MILVKASIPMSMRNFLMGCEHLSLWDIIDPFKKYSKYFIENKVVCCQGKAAERSASPAPLAALWSETSGGTRKPSKSRPGQGPRQRRQRASGCWAAETGGFVQLKL